ncbi:MAG: radical SAM family heme chaperone HemW [Chloroflexi bacterium]|nr:radical SAM family heme chaperone HemW [Chloroflexota bacterium]
MRPGPAGGDTDVHAATERRAEAEPGGAPGIGLYLHIPFCEKKCHYCDFNTYAGMDALIPRYVEALIAEVTRWGVALAGGQLPGTGPERAPARTVFFGGGTPSLLTPEQVAAILSACRRAFLLAEDAEVSLEANPGTLSVDLLRGFREAGVNRLSMGVQSFHDDELRWLGRIHSVAEVLASFERARAAGFANINLDLIYGLPRQSLDRWQESLRRALALRPEHLSCYALTVEEGTPLGRWVDQGRVPLPDPDLAADMYLATEEGLAAAGYEHYEISNWALPDRACRHNLIYWRNTPFLGCGAGAHSYLGGWRFADIRLPNHYIRAVACLAETALPDLSLAVQGEPLAEEALRRVAPVAMVEPIPPAVARGETMMLNLRLAEGVDPADFARRFGCTLEETYGPVLAELEGYGLLEWHEGRLRLSGRGRLLSNEVFVRFLERSQA